MEVGQEADEVLKKSVDKSKGKLDKYLLICQCEQDFGRLCHRLISEAMMARQGRISVTKESPSGRNLCYRDNVTGETMTRKQLVQQIQVGSYPNYHLRCVNGRLTPASNPDTNSCNNLD